MMAIVGGMVCVVRARRTKDSTITIRVKDVIITRRLGRMARPPKMITSLTGVDQSLPFAPLAVALSTSVIKSAMLGTVWFWVFAADGLPLGAGGEAGAGRLPAAAPNEALAAERTVSIRTTIAGGVS